MVSKAQIKATTKYETKTFDKVILRLRKDGSYGFTREELQKMAEAESKSVNQFIIDAIMEHMSGAEEIEREPFYD